MTTDIRIDDDFVSVEGPLKVNEVRPLSIKELNFPSPIKVDQIRPRSQKSILFISQGIKLLRSGQFDESLGTALAHGKNDKLVINEAGGYKGGVQIAGKVTVDNLSANQFVQTKDLGATDVQTTTLNAKKGVKTDELTAKKVFADSLSTKKFVQTIDLGATTVETKSALVKGDLTVAGKLVASGHKSLDLIELVLQLQAQVTKLQAQMDSLNK